VVGGNSAPGRRCPECPALPNYPAPFFTAKHPRQIFCCGKHKREWEDRTRRRGSQLYTFAVTARLTRGGTRGDKTTGAKAHADADQLMQRWRDEDSAAGRMSATDYLRLRYALGFDRP
jgi:hypothetical protein